MAMPGERIERVLNLVGMQASRHKTMRTFSSGMLQRIRLATAIIHEPPVLLLDEPYSNLDAPGREVVDQLLERAKSQGKITVLATNVASEAERCDRTINIQEFA